MKELYRFRQYLTEGRLLKEEVDVLGNEFLQDIQSEMKRMYSMDVDMDDIKDWVQMYYIGYNSEYDEGPGDVDYEGNEFGSEDYESEKKELVFDTGEREDFYMYLKDDLAEGKLLKEDQLKNDILKNKAEVEKQLKTKLKDFKIAGDDKVLTAVDPEEFTVYAFKYADEAGENFKSDEGYDPEIITIDGKKVAVTVGNI